MDEDTPAALPKDKAELLERIHLAREALDGTIGRLSDGQLVAPGPDEGWSVKDHLAHLAAWERGIAALLQRRPRYEAMGLDEHTYLTTDAEGLNAIIFEQHRGIALTDVRAALQQAQRQLLAALDALTDADLFRTYTHYQPDEPGEDTGRPILGWIAGNTYEHYAEHQAWIEAMSG